MRFTAPQAPSPASGIRSGRSWLAGALVMALTGLVQAQDGIDERKLREAEGPLRWIRLNGERAEQAKAAVAHKPAAPAADKPQAPKQRASKVARAASAASVASAESVAAPASMPGADMAKAEPPAAPAEAEPPLVTERREPQWPADLMNRLRRGRVELRFTVAPDGQLASASVAASSNAALEAAALAALRGGWHFAPTPTARSARVEFGFDLDGRANATAPSTAAAPAAEPQLEPLEQHDPEWDEVLVQKLRKGRVALSIEVGTDGQLRRAEITSISDQRLAAPALEAIRRWRFVPPAQVRRASIEFGFDLGP